MRAYAPSLFSGRYRLGARPKTCPVPRAVDGRGAKHWVGVENPLAASKSDVPSHAPVERAFSLTSVSRF